MEDIISEEKVINKFPAAYSLEATSYLQTDFSDKTKHRCFKEAERKIIQKEWLKINKVIIVGDVSVGKTCLVNRYCRKFFESNYKSTIGVDFEVEKFCVLGVPFILQIWDTAGQERFKSIAQSYYRGANVVIIVFDLTNCGTLSSSFKWLNEALAANMGMDPFIFLVGTKRDLLNNFSYQNIRSSALNLAKQMNAEYWGVSSKSGRNVNKLFRRIAALCFDEVMAKNYGCKREDIVIGEKLLGERSYRKKTTEGKPCCS